MCSRVLNRRIARRLFAHHLPIAFIATAGAVLLFITRPRADIVGRLSFATAYPALALLAVTLLIGPWTLLRKLPNPTSNDLRRDFGIWAGIAGVVHAVIGQCVHLRGRPWLYYVYGRQEHHHTFPIRHDLFGLANYTGLFSVILLVALFATSNDFSLRVLGTPRWKRLQRWNYAVFALAAVHAIGYLAIEKQKLPFIVLVGVLLEIAVVMQAAGLMLRYKNGRSLSPTQR
jgi:methionine sulfoxide reductase heme-binding subunit